MLRKELKAYNTEMLEKPFLTVLNKIDQEGSSEIAAEFISKYPYDPSTLHTISALKSINTAPLKEAIREMAQREHIHF